MQVGCVAEKAGRCWNLPAEGIFTWNKGTLDQEHKGVSYQEKNWIAQRFDNVKCMDQYQYLGNCPPTPPLTQQQLIENKLRLMLG